MEKKSFLLPHCCQVIGWWLLGLFVVVCITVEIIYYNQQSVAVGGYDFTRYLMALGFYFMPYVALLLICLSKEKVEDEYIGYIRSRSTFIVVIFYFVASMLCNAFSNYAVRILEPVIIGQFLMYAQWFCNTVILAIVYLLIFKGTLFVNKLKTRGDGE